MKALVAEYTGRGYKPWEVREHDTENNRAYLWHKWGNLLFRVVKKTGAVEFPPTDNSTWRAHVILTEEEWENHHKPDSYQLGRMVQDCRDAATLRRVADIMGVDCAVPPFPLKDESCRP
jgi:hypothetical protein